MRLHGGAGSRYVAGRSRTEALSASVRERPATYRDPAPPCSRIATRYGLHEPLERLTGRHPEQHGTVHPHDAADRPDRRGGSRRPATPRLPTVASYGQGVP